MPDWATELVHYGPLGVFAIHLEPHALKKLYAAFTNEEGADLPITIKIDPAVDTK